MPNSVVNICRKFRRNILAASSDTELIRCHGFPFSGLTWCIQMTTACSSKTQIHFSQTTRRHAPEYCVLFTATAVHIFVHVVILVEVFKRRHIEW